MNTTEIEASMEDVQSVVTDDLRGDKIERLLYAAGFDCEHKQGSEGVSVLEVVGEAVTIIVSETWEADGNWYIDPSAVILDKLIDDYGVDTLFPSVETEEDLVRVIEKFADEES